MRKTGSIKARVEPEIETLALFLASEAGIGLSKLLRLLIQNANKEEVKRWAQK